jgi:hypothetical protein
MRRRKLYAHLLLAALLAVSLVIATGGTYILAQPKEEAKKELPKEAGKEVAPGEEITGWRIKDFQPYIKALRDLEKLNREYSENLLKLAIDEYSTGLDLLEDMENEIIKLSAANKEKKNLNERFYWQEVDRKNQEERQIAKLKHEAKMKSVTYFTRSINHLDEIQYVEVRKEPKFINFQTRLYQVYVSTQYDLHNYKPCIPILERYIALTDANKKDVWAYKYLTSCYGFMEAVLAKYNKSAEDQITQYKQLKNRNMLLAIELQFGVESPEYKHLQEIVEQDEKKTEKINDFK